MDNTEQPENSMLRAICIRIEAKVDMVVARVNKLEAKSGAWGAVGGFLAILATKLAGCL